MNREGGVIEPIRRCPKCEGTNIERGEPIYASQSGVNHDAPFVVGYTPFRCRDCFSAAPVLSEGDTE